MKRLRWLTTLCLGLSVLVVGAAMSFASPNPPFQGWRHEDNHGQAKKHQREKKDRGLHRGWKRDKEGRYRFDDRERRQVDTYFRDHRRERWENPPRGYALGYGHVIEQRYRRYCRPMPVVLVREMPPPPRGLRYFLFGTNVVLVDSGYRVHDFIHIGINIGR